MKLIKSIVTDSFTPNFVNCNDKCGDGCCEKTDFKGSGTTLYTSKNRGQENSGKNPSTM